MKTTILALITLALAGCSTLCTSTTCEYPSLKVDQTIQGTGADGGSAAGGDSN